MDNEHEEYRYLHSTMQLKLTLWDRTKIFFGVDPMLGFCVRILVRKDENKDIRNLDVDMFSTRVLVKDVGDGLPTTKAKFNYEELHHKED